MAKITFNSEREAIAFYEDICTIVSIVAKHEPRTTLDKIVQRVQEMMLVDFDKEIVQDHVYGFTTLDELDNNAIKYVKNGK